MAFGGMTPYPRKLGGGKPRVEIVLEGLNADRGTAFDTSNTDSTVYVNNMAIARAIAAGWGTNERLSRIWDPMRMPEELVPRWEKILALAPLASDTLVARRRRIKSVLERFGQSTINGRIVTLLEEALGDAFVDVEYISYANAVILVPDGTYPWGTTGVSPWSSTVAHILVRLQKPTGWTEAQFYEAAGKVATLLDPILPVWTTVDWYRGGPTPVAVSGGPGAGGFFLDDDHNLDNEVFDV